MPPLPQHPATVACLSLRHAHKNASQFSMLKKREAICVQTRNCASAWAGTLRRKEELLRIVPGSS